MGVPKPLILLVDDCEDTREMYAEVLSASFDVLQASTAHEALTKASEFRPRAIVMDMMLPDSSGKDAIATLRRNPRTAHIPVVVVSGFSEPKQKSAPWDAYLVKPCHPDALSACLDRLIADSPTA
jgi:CheY-like chemotaxis protein